MAAPADGLPVIDPAPGPEGLACNFGHFFGNLAGGLSGRMIADALGGVAGCAPQFALSRLDVTRR